MDSPFLILLVDDSNENLDFLNEALRESYEVIIAKDGLQALRVVNRRRPDLILLDIVMPGMDGYEVCTELKSSPATREIPIIFLTGLANQLDKSRGFNLGAVDYITKPFNIVEVKARVKNQLLINQARKFLEQQNKQLESEVSRRTELLDRARENLEATEDKFRILFQRSVNALAFCRPLFDGNNRLHDFVYQDVNDNYLKLLGRNRKEIVGKREREIFSKIDPLWLETIRDAVSDKQDTLFELFHRAMGKYLLGAAFPITQDGKTFAIVLNDITERTLYQNQLIQAKEQAEESDRLKSAFLTNISHEIRTPLNGIIGFTQLMGQENITSNAKEHYIKIIEKCSHNLVSVIDEIIDFSHIESSSHALNYTRINLKRFLSNRLTWIREERDSLGKSEVDFFPRFPEEGEDFFITDRNRLKKVVDNLLSNALKFTDAGTVQLGYTIVNGRSLNIFVKDTGQGIGPQKKQIIFKSFRQVEEGYTREYGGMGLGLAITKKILSQMGGDINVVSRLGKGSLFTVTLPYREDFNGFNPLDDGTGDNQEVLRGKWVLILDKNKYTNETLTRLLKLREMNWIQASHMEEAQRLCREYPHIDVALINRNSLTVTTGDVPPMIKSFRRDIDCFLLGDPVPAGEKREIIDQGYRDMLFRPIEPESLYKALVASFKQNDE